jgi:hypothetical protein
MHIFNNSDLTCYINNEEATTKQICNDFCKINVKTIFIIYFPLGFITLSILIIKIIQLMNKKNYETKDIGLQCEFSILHHVVLEPDNSLSIVCSDN